MQRIRRSDLDETLLRIALGARLLGVAWLLLLAALAFLQRGDEIDRPVWVVGPMLVAASWGAAAILSFRRRPEIVVSRAAVLFDVGFAGVALVAPSLAGIPEVLFYGGLPLIAVAVAAIRSSSSAWGAAVVLSAVVIAKAPTQPLSRVLVDSISQVIIYAAAAFIFTWAIRLLRSSETERRLATAAAARAEERADISRHLHDSVLQTLALIQRSADRPEEVVSLARRQERDLREWLYGTPRTPESGLADAIRAAAAQVEDRYRVAVDVVTVGDLEITPAVEALVSASGEAMVNAAKHSGTATISVYVEVGAERATLFVRDRGGGFEPEAVPDDRRGIADSIRRRLEEVGGEAVLRTETGRGVEWRLEVPA